MADSILEVACDRAENGIKDDMTVIVTGIWRKQYGSPWMDKYKKNKEIEWRKIRYEIQYDEKECRKYDDR